MDKCSLTVVRAEPSAQVAIVGKGLTFDSGGYNLKAGPGSMIELMKFDMGGAAATLGAARILAATQPEGVEVRMTACMWFVLSM
jgi:leucyl aminopeptidase